MGEGYNGDDDDDDEDGGDADDDNSEKRVSKEAQHKQNSLFKNRMCCPAKGAQSGPPDTDHGHELGYVFTQWEEYPRADIRGDGESQLDEMLMRAAEIRLKMKMLVETCFWRHVVL